MLGGQICSSSKTRTVYIGLYAFRVPLEERRQKEREVFLICSFIKYLPCGFQKGTCNTLVVTLENVNFYKDNEHWEGEVDLKDS